MIRQQLIPEDKALPQMGRLLDVDAMAPVLARMLEEGSAIAALRISYLRYRPGRRLVVCYDVETANATHEVTAIAEPGADLAARASDPSNVRLGKKVAGRTPARTPIAHDPQLDALIQWLPVDIRLPVLAELPERVRDELEQAGLEIDADDLLQLVKHKPQNRAVMRLKRHFVKIYANAGSFAAAVHATHKAASLPLRTARCEAIVADRQIAVQSLVPGKRPAQSAHVATQAGALLRVLHGAQVSGLPLESSADQLDDAAGDAQLVSVLVPSLRARSERLLQELERKRPDESLLPSHGGFRGSQLLESDGELGVIDFDGFCRSPPARDLGSFTASLVEAPADLPEALATLDVLTDAYGRRPPGVTWYLTTYLLRGTRRPFTRLEEDWPDAVEERLHAAERALEL